MIEVIFGHDIERHSNTIADMFRMRYRVTTQELKWNLPDARAGYDIDAFDSPETIYLVLKTDGKVTACARLNPTDKPHLMSECFEDYCSLQPLPRSPKIMELSRFLIEKRGIDFETFRERQAQIVLAINEVGLARKLTGLSWLTYKRNYTEAATFWDLEPLGYPKADPETGAEYVAAISKIDRAGLERARLWAKQINPALASNSVLSQPIEALHYA